MFVRRMKGRWVERNFVVVVEGGARGRELQKTKVQDRVKRVSLEKAAMSLLRFTITKVTIFTQMDG